MPISPGALRAGQYLVPDGCKDKLLVFRPLGLERNEYGQDVVLTDVLYLRDRAVVSVSNVKVKQKILVATLGNFLPTPDRVLARPESRITAGFLEQITSPWVLTPASLDFSEWVRRMCEVSGWLTAERSSCTDRCPLVVEQSLEEEQQTV